MSHFITSSELAALARSEHPPVLLDLRFDPGKGSVPERYETGHIPGARFVNLEQLLADPSAPTIGVLPSTEQLQQDLRGLGLDNDTRIVAYDDTSGGPSARAWWVATWAGATQVQVLSGGLSAWTEAGYSVTSEPAPAVVEPGTFVVDPGRLAALDAAEVERLVGDPDTVLIDTRPAPAYAGSPGKPRSGHIPGAVSLPQSRFVATGGGAVSAERISELLRETGADGKRIVLYCGSGVSSSYAALALAEAGLRAELYPGSFSEWARDPERTVERSDEPQGGAK